MIAQCETFCEKGKIYLTEFNLLVKTQCCPSSIWLDIDCYLRSAKFLLKKPSNFLSKHPKLSQEQPQVLEGELMKLKCKDSKEQKQTGLGQEFYFS